MTTQRRLMEVVITRRRLGDAEEDADYWLSRSPAERLAAVEDFRREFHRWIPGAEPRLERVYRVTKLEDG